MDPIIPIVEPSLDYFWKYAQSHSELLDRESITVEFIVAFSERALLSGSDHTYYDPYLLAQLVSGAQGFCFMDPKDLKLSDLDAIAGKYVFELLSYVPHYIKIALLDAVYYHLNLIQKISPSATYEFRGLAAHKSIARARKIVELAGVASNSRVVMIGAIADIVRVILEKKAELQVADFALAGTEIEGVKIKYDAIPLIEWADIIIMTGNTLKTNTLGDLLDISRKLRKHVLVYAMSGANIAPRYLDYGASVVTSEPFPYYWYAQTPNIMNVYVKSQETG